MSHTVTETSTRLVTFYERDDELTGRAATFVAEGLLSGAGAVAMVAARLRPAFESELVQWGVDLGAARARDRLVLRDAGEVLEQISDAGRPDPAAFERRMVEMVGRAARAGRRPVRVFGEVAAIAAQAGHVDAAIELDEVGRQLAASRSVMLLCAYPAWLVRGGDPAGRRLLESVHGGDATVTGTLPEAMGPVGLALQAPARASRLFPATIDSPREARRFVARVLREVDGPELSEIATLVVSELAANAVGHARSAYRVSLSVESGRIRLAVSDASREEPTPRGAESAATTGRGLRLVDSLVDRWGVRPSGEGKEIWAEIATGN